MNLVGNPEGVLELKKIREERKEYLKFLITEAKTSFSRSATFKGSDGRTWKITFDGQKDEMSVEPG
jgi:hypothetical protein